MPRYICSLSPCAVLSSVQEWATLLHRCSKDEWTASSDSGGSALPSAKLHASVLPMRLCDFSSLNLPKASLWDGYLLVS